MVNPLKTHLHIFQLEDYSLRRFISWWLKHPFTFRVSQKKPLVYTPKTKLLLIISFVLYFAILISSIKHHSLFILFILLLTESFPLLFISLLLIKPYEIIRRAYTKKIVHSKIINHPHLTVIGITGSYGKTSTKDFLHFILSSNHKTLKTPESYNTLFGIAKTINLELHRQLQYFICEYGAYKRGEIKELTDTIPPQYAILTAIGTQHIERFKSLKNTTLAKFELIDAVKPENALLNFDNNLIRQYLQNSHYHKAKTYSLTHPETDFYVEKHILSNNGLSFTLKYQNQKYQFRSSVFGSSNLENLTAAISMSLILGMDISTIKTAVNLITSSPHRLELKKIGKATLIDDAYSSNQQGFINIINDLSRLKGKKALITPGIIELGKETTNIHQSLGTLIAPVFDTIILVGKSERTTAIEKGIESNHKLKPAINYLDNHSSLWPTINHLAQTHTWILLENDLPDNF